MSPIGGLLSRWNVATQHRGVFCAALTSARNIESEARIALLVAAAVAAIVFLGARRLVSGVPFLPPADYRSFAVFNRQYFVDLYGEDALPSKAPIEKLEGVSLAQLYLASPLTVVAGARWKWAFVQLICLVSLVIVDAVLLVTRVLQNGSYVEEGTSIWSCTVLSGSC